MKYVATFHTHLSAMITCRALARLNLAARMGPVPRKLSSSCGTCVHYEADGPRLENMDADMECVYLAGEDGAYTLVHQGSEP